MTLMYKEILQTPEIIREQADNHLLKIMRKNIGDIPQSVLTLARGTSDHAAEYLAYLLMRRCGIPVASLPLSLNTLHHTAWRAKNALGLTISQSGGSEDLLIGAQALENAGIPVLALLNTVPSPLSAACSHVVDIGAGKEQSVAATKSFVASISAGLHVFADWLADDTLLPALAQLPERLLAAQQQDWSPAIGQLKDSERLYVIGRGAGLAIAKEAALKCKETCLIQGEAFSGAEVQHGPMALVNAKQHILILAPPGVEQSGLLALAEKFRHMGGQVLLAADERIAERDLTLVDAGHAMLQGLTTIQSTYLMLEALSRARGIDTDTPPNLNKVTTTK